MFDLGNLLLGAGVNLLFALTLTFAVYFPRNRNEQYVFTFIVSNTAVFFTMGLLTRLEVGIGVGFGLFALFSILRYRTDTLPIREMTYLFVLMALPVLNSVLASQQAFAQLFISNITVIGVTVFLEYARAIPYFEREVIRYDNAALCVPARHAELLADLHERTGLDIRRVVVLKRDFLQDAAQLAIYHRPGAGTNERSS